MINTSLFKDIFKTAKICFSLFKRANNGFILKIFMFRPEAVCVSAAVRCSSVRVSVDSAMDERNHIKPAGFNNFSPSCECFSASL